MRAAGGRDNLRRRGREIVTRINSLIACALSALALCSSAAGAVGFGVTDDAGTGSDATWFFTTLNAAGLTENRVGISWDPAEPTTIRGQSTLDYWLPQAAIRGVTVIFAVAPAHPRDLTSSPAAPAQFAAFLAQLARTYPQVKNFVIGNEPNQPRFWQPQFDARRLGVSGGAYFNVLKQVYDALKGVDQNINVIGLGLSPRGNDNPTATSNISISPVRFIRDFGLAYRRSGRTTPVMDEVAFHPYPRQNNDSPAVGYTWPNAGLPNLDRIKQAVWDAFSKTAQPTFPEPGAARGTLSMVLDETGWQVGISQNLLSLYHGQENVTPVDEGTQARYYGAVVRMAVCDSGVRSVSFFHLIDETDLDRWQSGLLRADKTKRPAYDEVKNAIAQTAGSCPGTPTTWRHATKVQGAVVRLSRYRRPVAKANKVWAFRANAEEEALYRAGLFRVSGARLNAKARRVITAALANPRSRPALVATGKIKAYFGRVVRLPARRVKAGFYVYGVRLSASMNPDRANVFVGKPFRVGAVPKKKRR
jgi:hypothetical protein